MTEASYAYKAVGGTCKYSAAGSTGLGSTGYVNVAANSSTAMKTALASRPLSVSIEADKAVFQNYSSGIFSSTACGTTLDHAVMVVGYGTSGSTEYWTLRNSWGTSWGEKGYMRVAITTGAGICGIQMEPLYPTV
jgi:KDEL-tailed cysteine endopeptidase